MAWLWNVLSSQVWAISKVLIFSVKSLHIKKLRRREERRRKEEDEERGEEREGGEGWYLFLYS